MEEGKRKKELDRFYLSLFTFDEIILRGLTAVKVRPFSGSVNRKKIVDSAKLDQARGAWPRSVERNRNRKPIWRITSGSVSRLPFCLTDLFMRSPRVSNVSFSLLLLLLSHFRGGMEFGSGSIFFEIGIFSASFIFISLLSIIPSTWNSSNVFHEVHTVHKRGREFFLKAWTTIKLQRSWFLDISLDIYFLFGKK